MITRKEKSFLHLQKRNSSSHSRENLPASAPRYGLRGIGCLKQMPNAAGGADFGF
jgi:hypothetical protein